MICDSAELSFNVDGSRVVVHVSGAPQRPLLLIHSINAAASAAEVKPLCEIYNPTRQVHSLDLPGFGASERTDRKYTPRLMTDAVIEAGRAAYKGSGGPIDALAVSLSCEFLARAASEEPGIFRSVALVSPTGFSGKRSFRDAPGTTRGSTWIYRLLRGPGWGAALYRQLTRPSVIRYFLQRTWGSKQIDEELWATDIRMAGCPGAHFAPLYFLSAQLFSADIHVIYDKLLMPVWVSHGIRGDFVDYRQLAAFALRQGWRTSVFDTGALPYFENLPLFIAEYDRFIASLN